MGDDLNLDCDAYWLRHCEFADESCKRDVLLLPSEKLEMLTEFADGITKKTQREEERRLANLDWMVKEVLKVHPEHTWIAR
nr:TPA: hypothetical protein BN1204_019260 [Neospora caninum Liverpool]